MDEFSRELNVVVKGVLKKTILRVSHPYPLDSDWACTWSCEHLHPRPFIIRGPDPMGVFYYTLNGIGVYIREREKQGYVVWHLEEGDHGGFNFGKEAET